jgi:hypothetical protein
MAEAHDPLARRHTLAWHAPGGRGSPFDAAEVDALLRRTGRREPSPVTGDLVFRTGASH